MTEQQHKENVKTACTMATLSDALDEILENRPDLDRYWWSMFEKEEMWDDYSADGAAGM